ncbi:MAG: NADH-quinone oxidoreductase subunit NuoF [Nitrospirota bacterium]|nr:NADH-quinone oxidoreductase subunit NuoF [Nitrospirota bacterium]
MSKTTVIVGTGTCGLIAGARGVMDAVREETAKRGLDTNLFGSGCIGMSSHEPIMSVALPGRTRVMYEGVQGEMVADILAHQIDKGTPHPNHVFCQMREHADDVAYEGIPYYDDLPYAKKQVRVVLRNCGHINPEDIDHYTAREGYEAAKKALFMTPEAVINVVKQSGIRGRGGGGFPTGIKWDFCRKVEADQKYFICNADEGDPGAFMDRCVLEGDPHSVLEGMLIGGFAIGATIGYIYVRAEYPLAIQRLNIAISQAREKGFLGKNIFGSGFDFDILIKEGAGAFVCGEETALMASIEGLRGMPRPKPPFPAQKGLWGKPTVINNVETLANLNPIFLNGAEWYAAMGTEKSKGTKVFALTGKIQNTGLVEVPMGITLREIIYDIGGGIPDGKEFKAVQTGGPSGGCLPASFLDTPVDYESLIAAGGMMGSGGMVVMDETTCMIDMARFFLDFSQNESCGKCVPCRIGTKRMLETLEKICNRRGKPGDVEMLIELGTDVCNTSLCGLGQTAPNPVLSTIRHFKHEYDQVIEKKVCQYETCPGYKKPAPAGAAAKTKETAPA